MADPFGALRQLWQQRPENPVTIPKIMEALQLLSFDEGGFGEAAQRSNETPIQQGSVDMLERPGHAIASEGLGIVPREGEQLGNFWGRQFGNTMPPSLRQPLGQDIQLPSKGH